MQEFLLTHPSLFIITITLITIMLIYIFRDKLKKKYIQGEDTSVESTCSIEMQTLTDLPNNSCDEPDLITPLPNPKLYKKIRNDLKKPNYDVPRIHGLPETPKMNNNNEPSNLENLEKKYNLIPEPEPSPDPLINNSTPSVIHREKSKKNPDNRISVSDVYKHGSYVSFDGELDDLSRRSNVMRLTYWNFDPEEAPVDV